MITVQEALDLLKAHASNFGEEIIDLKDAFGRVLCEDIFADRDYPPFNRSAMDGFAIHALQPTSTLFRIVGEVYAGSIFNGEIGPGDCVKIMTGAPVPIGANTVIKIEDSEIVGEKVKFNVESQLPWQNIAKRGEDSKFGDCLISMFQMISTSEIGSLAALGKNTIKVFRQPSVAIISTGNELIELVEEVSSFQIRDSNSYVIEAFFKKHFIPVSFKKIVADDPVQLSKVIKECLNYDIVISSGGVSMGDADYLPTVFKNLGISKVFHKIEIKPGKPMWFGQTPQSLVFGLPGNPVSVQVACKIFIEPFLRKCFELPDQLIMKLPLLTSKKKKTKFDEFFPCKISTATHSGVEIIVYNGSGDVSATLGSDGLALHPSGTGELRIGDIVDFYPW